MFQSLILMAIKLALCQLYGFCIDHKDCPDGVCDDALKAIDNMNVPDITATPGKVQADFSSIDWSQLQRVTECVVDLIAALKAFFGINKVG